MLALLQSIKARLESSSEQVYLIDVPENTKPSFPYFVIWSSAGAEGALGLDGAQVHLVDESVGVTCVGLTPESALILSKRARVLLKGWAPSASGWHAVELRLSDARPVLADRDVTLPAPNRHPYYAVDLWALNASRT